jgi:hypothetical protein
MITLEEVWDGILRIYHNLKNKVVCEGSNNEENNSR